MSSMGRRPGGAVLAGLLLFVGASLSVQVGNAKAPLAAAEPLRHGEATACVSAALSQSMARRIHRLERENACLRSRVRTQDHLSKCGSARVGTVALLEEDELLSRGVNGTSRHQTVAVKATRVGAGLDHQTMLLLRTQLIEQAQYTNKPEVYVKLVKERFSASVWYCNWRGVTCSKDGLGRVVKLALKMNTVFPPSSVAGLKHLAFLMLTGLQRLRFGKAIPWDSLSKDDFLQSWHTLGALREAHLSYPSSPLKTPHRFAPNLEVLRLRVGMASGNNVAAEWAGARRLRKASIQAGAVNLSGIEGAPALKVLKLFTGSPLPPNFPLTLERLGLYRSAPTVRGSAGGAVRINWKNWCGALEGVTFYGYTPLSLLHGLGECKGLRKLELVDVHGLDSSSWTGRIPRDLEDLPELKTFTWRNVTGTDKRGFHLPKSAALVRVDLSSNGLTKLPSDIGNYPNLVHLDASRNALMGLPSTILQLKKLKNLYLRFNDIEVMGPKMTKFIKEVISRNAEEVARKRYSTEEHEEIVDHYKSILSSRFLQGNPFFKSDNRVKRERQWASVLLDELEEMGVVSQRLERTQAVLCNRGIFKCSKPQFSQALVIFAIDLSGLNLRSVPLSLVNITMPGVQIDLSNNPISEIPPEFASLKDVNSIDLTNNKLTSFPEPLLGAQVEKLSLAKNTLSGGLPESLATSQLCATLIALDISATGMKEIPGSLNSCSKLQRLVAMDNMIVRIHRSWYTLRDLVLDGNRLTSEAVDGLSMNAREISLASNLLDRWPDLRGVYPFQRMMGIERLDLSHNAIRHIDAGVYGLAVPPRLQIMELVVRDLYLDHNQIEVLPDTMFTTYVFCRSLHLMNNKIRRIPGTLHNSRHQMVDLSHNLLEDFPLPAFANSTSTPAEIVAEIERQDQVAVDGKLQFYYPGNLSDFGYVAGQERTFPMSFLRLDFNRLERISSLGAAAMMGVMKRSHSQFILSMVGNPSLIPGDLVVTPGTRVYMDTEVIQAVRPAASALQNRQLEDMIRYFDITDEQRKGLEEDVHLMRKLRTLSGTAARLSLKPQLTSFAPLSDDLSRSGVNEGTSAFKDCMAMNILINGREVVFVRCLCIDKFYESRTNPYHCRQCPRFGTCSSGRARCDDDRHLKQLQVDVENLTVNPDIICQPCPEGAVCDGTNELIPTKGHWKDQSNTEVFYQCANPDACLGGEGSECSEGYTGVLCGMCEHGYYSSGAHQCAQCPSAMASIIVFVLGAGAIGGSAAMLFVLAASMLDRERAMRKARLSEGGIMLSQSVSSLRLLMDSTNSLKMSISFLQIITSLSITFDVEWPAFMNVLDDVFGWVNLDIMRSTSFECIWELFSHSSEGVDGSVQSPGFGYPQRMAIAVLCLIVASVVQWAVFYSHALARRALRPKEPTGGFRRTTLQIQVLILQLGYLPISYLAIQYFHCTSYDGGATYYIANDLSTRCYHGDYWLYGVGAILTMVLYTLGLPAIILATGLWRNGTLPCLGRRRVSGHKDQDNSFGAIVCQGYHPRYQWWDAFEMLRRVIVGGLVVLLSGSSIFQLTVAMGVMFVFTVLHFRCWPHITRRSNITQAVFLVLTYFTMSLGVLRTLEVPQEQSTMFAAVVLLVDVLVLVSLAAMVSHDLIRIVIEKTDGVMRHLRALHAR